MLNLCYCRILEGQFSIHLEADRGGGIPYEFAHVAYSCAEYIANVWLRWPMWTTGDVSSFSSLVNLTVLHLSGRENLQGALWRFQIHSNLLYDTAEAVTRMFLVEPPQATSAPSRD